MNRNLSLSQPFSKNWIFKLNKKKFVIKELVITHSLVSLIFSSQWVGSTGCWKGGRHRTAESEPRRRSTQQRFSSIWPPRSWNWRETPARIWKWRESRPGISSWRSAETRSSTLSSKAPSPAAESSHTFTSLSSTSPPKSDDIIWLSSYVTLVSLFLCQLIFFGVSLVRFGLVCRCLFSTVQSVSMVIFWMQLFFFSFSFSRLMTLFMRSWIVLSRSCNPMLLN